MYYISREGTLSPARKVKRLSDFMRFTIAEEGSRWTVRTKVSVAMLDMLPVYQVKQGKLSKTDAMNTMWWSTKN